MNAIAENLQEIEERILRSCNQAGRERDTVRLMAISKQQPHDRIRGAIEIGVRLFGENRVQETLEKLALYPDDAEIHLVGHLQRNKARDAATTYHGVQSLDAVRTVNALEARLAEVERTIPVLVEVNTSGEASKYGVTDYDGLRQVAVAIEACDHMHLNGLMTLGPFNADEVTLRNAFALLRTFRDRLQNEVGHTLPELSMGMSNDFEPAILEGATTVRIGNLLFGERKR